MNRIDDILLTDLRHLIRDLGKDGGLIGPSIYDTAQVIRFAPPTVGVWPAIEWLLEQQHRDGGWGDPVVPRARDVPTLAAVLALHGYSKRKATRDAVASGLAFLRRQAVQWMGTLPEDIPIATELILPALLMQSRQLGFDLAEGSYAALEALGRRRLRLMSQLKLQPGTTPVHSWEAWGQGCDTSLVDSADSLGHSPAATAAWLRATRDCADIDARRSAAQRYLERAAAATGVNIPGVVPTVWPYESNESVVSLFVVLLAGLIDHPALRDVTAAQVNALWNALRPQGQGISAHFTTDGDITAMSFAIVASAGYRPDLTILRRYITNNYCLTYPNEMQRSFSATAHAAHTLALLGGDPMPLLDYLCEHRAPDGRWAGDKWHASWLYLTSQTIHALIAAERTEDALGALAALINHQRPDGSWGTTNATAEETAYGVLGLLAFEPYGLLPEPGRAAVRRAGRYLLSSYRPLTEESGACWIGKEIYRPRRISRTIELSATMAYVFAERKWGHDGVS